MARGQFRDVGELRVAMDALFDLLSHAPVIGPALRDANVPRRFVFTDFGPTRDAAAARAAAEGALQWTWQGDPPWRPALVLHMRSDVANRFWQGKLNILFAVA